MGRFKRKDKALERPYFFAKRFGRKFFKILHPTAKKMFDLSEISLVI